MEIFHSGSQITSIIEVFFKKFCSLYSDHHFPQNVPNVDLLFISSAPVNIFRIHTRC